MYLTSCLLYRYRYYRNIIPKASVATLLKIKDQEGTMDAYKVGYNSIIKASLSDVFVYTIQCRPRRDDPSIPKVNVFHHNVETSMGLQHNI